MGIVEQYLLQLNIEKRRLRRAAAILTVLSLLVAVGVSWNLRMTGITLVNDACCGYTEHLHTEECLAQNTVSDHDEEGLPHTPADECCQNDYQCGYDEHLHSLACYSNPKADVETLLDWQQAFETYPYSGDLREDLVGIAKTQVGYTESALNFEADNDGERHGYTRYGAWYGAPYTEWSAMFVSFCLYYAGANLNEYPISSGADTMAGLWEQQKKYIPAGQYSPVRGDLAFFDDNTVGIVAEVQSTTMYIICGDMHDAVSGSIMSVSDDCITGWGVIDKTVADDPVTDAFIEENRTFTLSVGNARSDNDLAVYLQGNGGTYHYTLTNAKNENLDPDDDKHYDVTINEGYKLVLSIDSPNGIESGTYTLQLPYGLLYDDGTGEIIIKNGSDESQWVSVGTWTVSGDGVVTIVFNEEMDSLTENMINATIGIHFPEQKESIDFDGKITVTVLPPAEHTYPTKILKSGEQGVESKNQDPTKIYWSVQITGDRDSQIVGNTLTDNIVVGKWSDEHHYTESDIARGIHFGVWENDDWHDWDVLPDDPNLIWTENGWSYKIPETAVCIYCGEIELGNEGWTYNISYTSTPDPISIAGEYGYENIVSIDDTTKNGWAEFAQGEAYGDITKSGTFISDAGNGSFLWEIQATIPGRAPDKKADYYWYFMDYLYLHDKNYQKSFVHNNADLSVVTAKYQGAVVRVPHLNDVTDDDMFAWYVTYSPADDITGTVYGREIVLLSRCHCNENNCQLGGGDSCWRFRGEFCNCWTAEEDITFTFVYKTNAPPLIEAYGGQGYRLQNIAELYYRPSLDWTVNPSKTGSAVAEQAIPGVFKKDITKDFDGYSAHYQITVNEAKAVLTSGDPLIIKDTMSETLAYISGSLVIKSEDADGNLSELKEGEHYTVSYDGSGNRKDEQGNELHILLITILTPQPVKYILDYDTTVLKPDTITGAVTYSNSAAILLWGDEIKSDIDKIANEFNMAARNYAVKLHKTCALTQKPLAGAVFGIYNEQGGLITTGETDNDGYLIIETDLKKGIVLREHLLYYAQEHTPPTAYMLDDKENWFIFCNSSAETCDTCSACMGDKNAVRIPLGQVGNMDLVNEPISYELPATGGTGITLYVLCGLVLITAPLVYVLSLRRKYGRRSQE